MKLILFLLGAACIFSCILLLKDEMERRYAHAKAMMHSVITPLQKTFKPYYISSTQFYIGRRSRRCELVVNLPYISCIHATMWWDGDTFHIAPVYTKRRDGNDSMPSVLVNGEAADENGLPVLYGDVVTLSYRENSNESFKFILKNALEGNLYDENIYC